MNIKDIVTVGQTVYVLPVNNLARYDNQQGTPIEERIKEDVVTKVGNKYFYLENTGAGEMKFGIGHHNTLMDISDYSANYHVYLDKQEILDKKEYEGLKNKMKKCFDVFSTVNLNLDQLRRINNIIKEGGNDE